MGPRCQAPMFHNVHRWYEPQTGRYTRPDPIHKGSATRDGEYSYVMSRPTRFTDPLGLFSVDDNCFECYPDEARDWVPLGWRLRLGVRAWCLSRLDEIVDVSLRKCIQESCDSGRISCRDRGSCRRNPDWTGFTRGGTRMDHWARRIGWQRKIRRAFVCSNNPLNYTPWGGAETVIHEWAHGCGYWPHGDRTIPGIPHSE
jgi:hypothetical protein